MNNLLNSLKNDNLYITLETTPSKSPTINTLLDEIHKFD